MLELRSTCFLPRPKILVLQLDLSLWCNGSEIYFFKPSLRVLKDISSPTNLFKSIQSVQINPQKLRNPFKLIHRSMRGQLCAAARCTHWFIMCLFCYSFWNFVVRSAYAYLWASSRVFTPSSLFFSYIYFLNTLNYASHIVTFSAFLKSRPTYGEKNNM